MAKILDRLPFINLWGWADGNEYTTEEDNTILPPELATSDAQTDKAYEERFRKQPKKGNGGKGKENSFKEETKVNKEQLNKQKTQSPKKQEKSNEQKEIVD